MQLRITFDARWHNKQLLWDFFWGWGIGVIMPLSFFYVYGLRMNTRCQKLSWLTLSSIRTWPRAWPAWAWQRPLRRPATTQLIHNARPERIDIMLPYIKKKSHFLLVFVIYNKILQATKRKLTIKKNDLYYYLWNDEQEKYMGLGGKKIKKRGKGKK